MRSIACLTLSFVVFALGTQSAFSQSEVAVPPVPPPLIDSQPTVQEEPLDLPIGAPTSPEAAPVRPSTPEPQPPIVTATEDVQGAETSSYQDWALECFSDPEACQITHRVLAAEGSQIIVVVAVLSEADGGPAQLQIAVPLGVSASAGIRLAIGAEYQANIPIARCTPQGCLVEGTASDALLSAMRRSGQGQISVVNDTGATIDLPFSLMGFSASYSEMIERNAAR